MADAELTRRELEAILERDRSTAATWFAGPASGPSQAYRDRHALLEHIRALEAACQAFAILVNDMLGEIERYGGPDSLKATMAAHDLEFTEHAGARELLIFNALPTRPILHLPAQLPLDDDVRADALAPPLGRGPLLEAGELESCLNCVALAVLCNHCGRCPNCCECANANTPA